MKNEKGMNPLKPGIGCYKLHSCPLQDILIHGIKINKSQCDFKC